MKRARHEIAVHEGCFLTAMRLKSALAEIEKHEQEISTARTEINRFKAEINSRFAEQFDDITRVREEIVRFAGQQQRSYGHQSPPPPIKKPRKPSTKTLRKLYRLMAQRCHPDKTDDPALIEMFMLAKAAYEDRDLDAMKALYAGVAISRSAEERMTLKLERAQQRLGEVRHSLELIRKSEIANAMNKWRQTVAEQGQAAADKMVEENLNNALRHFESELARLKAPVVTRVFYGASTSACHVEFRVNR